MAAIELYNEDCMVIMGKYPDNYFELAIVDPEYGIGIQKAGYIGAQGRKIKQPNGSVSIVQTDRYHTFNDERPSSEYFKELFRVSKNQIIWGGNHLADLIDRPSPCWIVWDKVNTGNFADCELAYTSFNTAVRKVTYMWNGMLQGKSVHEGAVAIGNKKLNEKRIHPTQKPVKLYEWVLQNYANEDDKILDTHLGSGSSAIAAHYGGFDFVGCELDPDYFKATKTRFDEQTAQISMF